MKRAVFKLKDGEYINVPADQIDKQGDWVVAWQGEDNVLSVIRKLKMRGE